HGASEAAGQERAAAVTFSRDIAPILFEHCVVCHRPGAVGPMSLMSYQEVRPWARSIEEQVGAKAGPHVTTVTKVRYSRAAIAAFNRCCNSRFPGARRV